MESSVLVAIISVGGAGLIAGLGYFMKHLVDGIGAKIDKLEKDLNARIDKLDESLNARIDKLEAKVDKLEEDLTALKVSVAKIATTQQEHSAKGHGERISALEGATFGAGAKTPTSG